jgi:hypothetical protein
MAAIEYAFKCRNCGTLEPPDAAGELEVPAKCHICGKGAHYDTDTGVRVLDPDNWITLADLEGKELDDLHEFHKFDPKLHKIVKHTPAKPVPLGREPVAIEATAGEGVSAEDVQDLSTVLGSEDK